MRALLLLLAALSPAALAAPFLVSDPYPPSERQPTEFVLRFDGAHQPVISPAQTGAGGVRLRHDLADLPKGRHTVTVKARAPGAESATTEPFAFDLSDLAMPKGLKLEIKITVEAP